MVWSRLFESSLWLWGRDEREQGRGGVGSGVEEGAVDGGGGRGAHGACEEARRGELECGAEEHGAVPVWQELPAPVGEPPPTQPQEGCLLAGGGAPHPRAPRQARQQVGSHGRSGSAPPNSSSQPVFIIS